MVNQDRLTKPEKKQAHISILEGALLKVYNPIEFTGVLCVNGACVANR